MSTAADAGSFEAHSRRILLQEGEDEVLDKVAPGIWCILCCGCAAVAWNELKASYLRQVDEEEYQEEQDSLMDSTCSSRTSDDEEEDETLESRPQVDAYVHESMSAPADCSQRAVLPSHAPSASGQVSHIGGDIAWGMQHENGRREPANDCLGIGYRTRARCPLQDVTLEQLEAFTLPEEDLLPVSDDDYYQEFLEVCCALPPPFPLPPNHFAERMNESVKYGIRISSQQMSRCEGGRKVRLGASHMMSFTAEAKGDFTTETPFVLSGSSVMSSGMDMYSG